MRCLRYLLVAVLALTAVAADRTRYNFNPAWKLLVGDPAGADAPAFDDSAWKSVATPYAWNQESAFRVSIHDLPTGIAWYRKHFKLPASAAGQKIVLEFEGIRLAGEFYLNGKSIGRHENGVMAFGFDITAAVKPAPQENVLAVRIDNAWDYHEKASNSPFQWNDRNFYANYGGINKNVYLHVLPRLHQTLPLYSTLGTTGVYIYAQDFDIAGQSATITAEAQVKNEFDAPRTFTYEAAILDRYGRPVQTIDGGQYTLKAGETRAVKASAKVSGLHFWSWGYGYLYTVNTILKVGGQAVDTVSTRTGFRKTEFAHGMVSLNDRVIQIKGYAQRTTNEWPAVGLSVPAWMSDFSNRMIVEGNGNLVRWMHVTPWKQDIESCDRVGLMEAMPAGDSEGDVTGRRWEQRVELMRDAIIYNRNNPSIVFYESGNKGITDDHMSQMKALRDQYDPYGGRAAGAREMLASTVAEYGGEMLYIDKSSTKPLWMMEYSRDEALRKYWDELSPPFHKDGPDYNRNQDSQALEDIRRWYEYWTERPGTGDRVNGGGVNIIFSDSNTHFRGDENFRRSGEVDAMRIPKEAYYANQIMWDGWVEPEKPLVHIIGHWNYAPGTKKTVYVVSNADRVELMLNNKSLGVGKQSYRFLYTFPDVEWQAGTLQAMAYNSSSARSVAQARVDTAAAPSYIWLDTRTGHDGLLANGSDLALVDVEVRDGQGRRCPTCFNQIRFTLSGPAEFLGGIAQGPDNYILAKTLPVENGVTRVLIRATNQPGRIVLQANSEGLQMGAIDLISRPVAVTGGLSNENPSGDQQPFLGRGPTPSGQSLKTARTPVKIVSATAGANQADAVRTFDDNETTHWASDGQLSTAWIEYTFAEPAAPTQLVMKLMSWRNRSYPIRVTVDGQEVFAGATPASLGYVTIPLKPVSGKSLKIEMTGPAKGQNGIDITELKPDVRDPAATGEGLSSAATLSIVEAEIYR